MFRIIRTTTLAALHADRVELAAVRAELEATRAARQAAEGREADAAIREEDTAIDLEKTRVELAAVRAELETLRAQHLLDTEDRATLRALLRTARKQAARNHVYALFRHGQLHSLHATTEAAEEAAEAEGAPREGWTTLKPGAALPPAAEVAWRVQPLPLGGV
ncbi:hypothetical protein [Streptomyces sp. URMC 125]|uniref:hypothetical protein n=1 Tax=Streptomyces sp. URMC 125 TaxID=3423419 RepID=UPI003F1943F1